MKKVCIFLLTVSLLYGCATSYKKNGFSGGYTETQLSENIFNVSFAGNAHTSGERASDFALLRSAELTIKHDYKYFVIINTNNIMTNSTYTTPITSNTTASAYNHGNHTYGNATTITSGGETYIISKPSSSNTIACFANKPEKGFAYNAEFIYKSITEKYNIKK